MMIKRVLLELSAFIALGLAALFAFMRVWWLFALCLTTWYLLYGFVGMAYNACAKGRLALSQFFLSITIPFALYPFRRANYYWLKAANLVSSKPRDRDASRQALEITGMVDIDGLLTDNNKASFFTFLAALHLDLGNIDLVRIYLDKVKVIPHKSVLDDELKRLHGIMTSVSMRLALPADAPLIAYIHMRSWDAAYKDILPADYIRKNNSTRYEMWNSLLTEGNTTQFAILKCGEIIGLLGIGPPKDDDLGDEFYELYAIYLHPDHFHQGVGTQAMELAFRIARSLWKTDIVVWVFADNINSVRFFEKCGYIADGRTHDMDCGKVMNCIRMRCKLKDEAAKPPEQPTNIQDM